jgi:FAD binding domain-containing protein/aromatic ring hydroxylase-like protein
MYWLINDELPALIGPMDRGDRWFFMPTHVPADMAFSNQDVPGLIRRATGIDLPYEVLSSDEWIASQLVADRYRDRRVFLIGDACHLHPPFGGYGMNMGIADGVDLGWKIAAVLRGWGGAALLESYQAERRPVHQYVISEAVANHALLGNQLWRAQIEADGPEGEKVRQEVGDLIRNTKAREFHALGVVKGYRYEDSPVLVSESGALPSLDWREYQPSAHPGCIAPHAWLQDGSSLYDHFGDGFTLLCTEGAIDSGAEEILRAARALGVPVKPLPAPHLAKLYQARYTLVRPDQHVAWRGHDSADAGSIIARVVGMSSGGRHGT